MATVRCKLLIVLHPCLRHIVVDHSASIDWTKSIPCGIGCILLCAQYPCCCVFDFFRLYSCTFVIHKNKERNKRVQHADTGGNKNEKKERQRKQKARQTTAIPNLITILLSYIIISIEIRRKKNLSSANKSFCCCFRCFWGEHGPAFDRTHKATSCIFGISWLENGISCTEIKTCFAYESITAHAYPIIRLLSK